MPPEQVLRGVRSCDLCIPPVPLSVFVDVHRSSGSTDFRPLTWSDVASNVHPCVRELLPPLLPPGRALPPALLPAGGFEWLEEPSANGSSTPTALCASMERHPTTRDRSIATRTARGAPPTPWRARLAGDGCEDAGARPQPSAAGTEADPPPIERAYGVYATLRGRGRGQLPPPVAPVGLRGVDEERGTGSAEGPIPRSGTGCANGSGELDASSLVLPKATRRNDARAWCRLQFGPTSPAAYRVSA